ncbi:MAG: histidine kinase, partial [Bacteroidota bacterium]
MAKQLITYSLQLFSKPIFRHGSIWVGILLILMLNQGFSDGFGFAFFNTLIIVSFYAAVVYFNLYYLIPEYLSKNKFLLYSTLLFVSCLIITPLREITQYFYFEVTANEAAQESLLQTINFQFLITFFVVGASTILKIISDWVRHTRERQELQTRTMQSELRFLKSQINPHFLFNTLNNLYALTLKKDDKAPEIVIKLSEMMRYMLYECNERRVLLQKEINYIRNYLDLESLRQGKNVTIEFEVNGRVSDQQIAPLMFIPFLENSFKHGLNHSITEGFVRIELNVDEKEVNFHIENSKADRIVTPTRGKSGGIGLVNVRRRLDLLYPDQYDLSVEDRPNTYAANLLL